MMRKYLLKSPDENIGVVTFNYDTIFEDSLSKILDCPFNTIDDYLVRAKEGDGVHLNDIMVFKPHGSSNWIQKLNDGGIVANTPSRESKDIANRFYDLRTDYASLFLAIEPSARNSDLNLKEIVPFSVNTFQILYTSKTLFEYYPMLLVPFKKKDESLMPLSHQNHFTHQLRDVEEILIIGWKGTEDHFNKILGQKLSQKKIKISYVSPHTKTVQNELSKYLPLAEFKHHACGFSEFIENTKAKNPEFDFFLK
jgi:hypothetical protein